MAVFETPSKIVVNNVQLISANITLYTSLLQLTVGILLVPPISRFFAKYKYDLQLIRLTRIAGIKN